MLFRSPIETDPKFKNKFINDTFQLIGGFGVPAIAIQFSQIVFPYKGSLEYDKRTRKTFSFNWKDNFSDRSGDSVEYPLGILAQESSFSSLLPNTKTFAIASKWPLDIHFDYKTKTNRNPDNNKYNDNTNSGILQHSLMYGRDLDLTTTADAVADLSSENLQVHPLLSYKHTITPLTSCVGPYGMDIEGVNSGSSLFTDLSSDHLLSEIGRAHV